MKNFFRTITFIVLLFPSVPVFALDAPNLTVTTTGVTVNLSWTPSFDATGISLFYAPYPYTTDDTIMSVGLGSETSLTFDLWEGAAFYVAIGANNASGEIVYSNVELLQIPVAAPPPSTPSTESGSYRVTNTVDATGCGEGVYTYTTTFSFHREGNAVTFSGRDDDGDSFVLEGTITGNTALVSGSYREDGGTNRLTSNVTFSGDSFTGTHSWTWSNGYMSCSGDGTISGTRI